jgi:lipoprotein-anchoring transpeptidase ErfK/SrfK
MTLRRRIAWFIVAVLLVPLLSPLQPADAAGAKKIVVDISDQRVYAYEGTRLAFVLRMNASGTRGGTFHIRNKIPMATSYVLGWKLPHWMGLYYSGGLENGFHGAAINRRGGRAYNSFGCIVMAPASAAKLYNWARVGTLVVVRR